MKRPVSLVVLSLIMALALVSGCGGKPATSLSGDEQIAIYAAIVRQLYLVDHTFDKTPNFPVVYLIKFTDDTVGDPSAPKSESRPLSRQIQLGIPTRLSDLLTQFLWVGNMDAVPVDSNGMVKNGGAVITLGNTLLQEDGSVLVSAKLYISPLAATGKTYILEETGGVWQIVGDTGGQWISEIINSKS